MHRSFTSRTTRRYFTTALLLGAGASSFVACIPFDTEEEYLPPMNGGTDVVSAAKPPPPISGGTLVVSGKTAVATDPDRDRVSIVDLSTKKVTATVALNEGDEPGRVVVDDAGRAHVALRRGGAVATLDLASGKVVDRRDVCGAPRGIAFDAAKDQIHVACMGGELVSLPAAGGAAVRTLRLERDLRDVIVSGDKLLVSRFRAAELMTVAADGSVLEKSGPAKFNMFEQSFEPAVAWRSVGLPNGAVAMVHQRSMTTPVTIEQGGYGSGGCDGSIVHSAITVFSGEVAPVAGPLAMPAMQFAVLPVDMAASKDGNSFAMVAAGNNMVLRANRGDLEQEAMQSADFGGCAGSPQQTPVGGEPIAVAFDDANHVIVQTREPASLLLLDTEQKIPLGGVSVADTGHDMFHTNPNGQSAMVCASCHPEGRDDGRTWNFSPIGARRTQFTSGGILATAPLHWDGDMDGIDTIMAEVFVKRMGGIAQGPRRIKAFAKWIDALPELPRSAPVDVAAVERGKALFNDAKVACASCHEGTRLTNNKSVDVGTGRAFQVPSLLNIADRAPFMHDGCAATLHDRFSPYCGGGDKHGTTSHLSPSDIDDLVAYLETL